MNATCAAVGVLLHMLLCVTCAADTLQLYLSDAFVGDLCRALLLYRQLQGLALQGQLPASLGQLPALQTLNLGSNAFSGPLPSSWGSNSGLQNLSFLDLSKNGLSGALPSQWGAAGQFPALSQLSLDSNNFSGQLPPSWATAGNHGPCPLPTPPPPN